MHVHVPRMIETPLTHERNMRCREADSSTVSVTNTSMSSPSVLASVSYQALYQAQLEPGSPLPLPTPSHLKDTAVQHLAA
jgi:hypothetical protein